MKVIKEKTNYHVKNSYLDFFLDSFWYIPSDVLQRGMEANIWDLCTFTSKVLDIGIGNGRVTDYIFKNKHVIDIGIDIDDKGVNAAKKSKMYKKVICANAEEMPFKDGSFATVISNSTFEHIKNDKKAIAEVSRVLKTKGFFLVTIPSNFLEEWILEFETKKNPVEAASKLKSFNYRSNHLHYHSLEEWEQVLRENGLSIVYSRHYLKKNVALYWYRLFKVFTSKVGDRELWSLLGDSQLTKFIPKKQVKYLMKNILLQKAFTNGFLTNSEPGAQLFIIAQKKI